jgi:hypothetical protein
VKRRKSRERGGDENVVAGGVGRSGREESRAVRVAFSFESTRVYIAERDSDIE